MNFYQNVIVVVGKVRLATLHTIYRHLFKTQQQQKCEQQHKCRREKRRNVKHMKNLYTNRLLFLHTRIPYLCAFSLDFLLATMYNVCDNTRFFYIFSSNYFVALCVCVSLTLFFLPFGVSERKNYLKNTKFFHHDGPSEPIFLWKQTEPEEKSFFLRTFHKFHKIETLVSSYCWPLLCICVCIALCTVHTMLFRLLHQ